MKKIVLCLLALAMPALTVAPAHGKEAHLPVVDEIVEYRETTWRWQTLMGVRRTATRHHERWAKHEYRRWLLDFWRKRATKAHRRAQNPPHERTWRCIQRNEAHWRDPNPPYYGGLQMDISFQRLYGRELLRRKGTADRWTPVEQMWVAERAYRSGRGFHPWPNTARACGVL